MDSRQRRTFSPIGVGSDGEGRLGMVGGLNQDAAPVYGDNLARDHG